MDIDYGLGIACLVVVGIAYVWAWGFEWVRRTDERAGRRLRRERPVPSCYDAAAVYEGEWGG